MADIAVIILLSLKLYVNIVFSFGVSYEVFLKLGTVNNVKSFIILKLDGGLSK